MQLREILTTATALLAAKEDLRDTARRDSEFLLLQQLSLSRAQLLTDPDRELTAEEVFFYWQSVRRRAAGEPIQYILGQQEFYGRIFHVAPAVLIPRPETEHLVEAVLARLPCDRPLQLLDVGTGSGILAVTFALHLPHAEITAVDISPEALAVARGNAEHHHVADRIQFLHSDLLAKVRGPLDAVVSNPPYIPDTDRTTLHPQVRDHEPPTALFAGPDGLDIYRRLIPQAHAALTPDGLLALEIGHGQRKDIEGLLSKWHEVSFVDDLQQIPRVALARRP
jgi:release factor glutamine methyltransferase